MEYILPNNAKLGREVLNAEARRTRRWRGVDPVKYSLRNLSVLRASALNGTLLVATLSAAFAQQPEMGQLDASPSLFTVMAAINAARSMTCRSIPPIIIRCAKPSAMSWLKKNIPSLAAIKAFYVKHPGVDSYISFAITCEGPPNFVIRKKDMEVPPD